ncbi:MAG: hypothetical protein WBQ94_26520 [Terracidiphilus sp.]
MKASFSVLLVALVTVTCAQSVPTFSGSVPSAVSPGLEATKIFALGPVGYAGTTSREERQFKAVFTLDRDKAKQELERLYSSKNPLAMSYALVGMRKLDRKRYEELRRAARATDVTVTTMWGCIVESEKLRTVANDLDSGKYDPWLRWMEKLSL